MERRRLLALSGGLFAVALAGCVGNDGTDDAADTDATDENTPEQADETDENADETSHSSVEDDTETTAGVEDDDMETLVAGTNGFAFDLYRELLAETPDENLFTSPVSISLALAMTYAGAREETREQMRESLRYELDDGLLHAAFGELQRELDERGEGETEEDEIEEDDSEEGDEDDATDDRADDAEQPFELSVVNSVWGQEEFPFEDAYLDILETHYGSPLREVDYRTDAEGAREEINQWVADETEDRIDDLLPQGSLDSLTRLVLVNAVYFLASWQYPFPEGRTEAETFTALDGSEHDVQLMRQEHTWEYATVDGAQAVDLPYVGEEVSMLVILPPEGQFETYESEFDEETLETVVDELEHEDGTVALPRFEFEGSFQLSSALEALGMTDAFDPQAANFEGIADTDELFIHEAFHDTFVAVDEEGTEAAAATGVAIGVTAAPADPFEFVADRPFLFAIRDRPTGSLLFLGRAVDPTDWE